LNVRSRPIASDSDADNEDNSDFENSDSIGDINEDANSDAEYPPKTDDEAEDYILTAIEQRIQANNALVADKIV
jgi:hypothetical protein